MSAACLRRVTRQFVVPSVTKRSVRRRKSSELCAIAHSSLIDRINDHRLTCRKLSRVQLATPGPSINWPRPFPYRCIASHEL